MAINKTYINAGDELIIQGSLIVEGNLIQKQYTQINNFEETRFEGELLTINSDGFDPTGNITNGALRLRSGNDYFYLTFDPSSPNGGTVFDGPITATSLHLTDGGNITRDPQALRAEFDGNSAGAHQLTEEVTIVFNSVDFTTDSNTFVDAGDVTTITSNLIDQTAISLTDGTYGKVDTVAKFTVNNKGIVIHAEDKYIDIISAQINDFTQRVRGNISVEMTNPTTGDGGIDYDEANGIIKYTGPVASEIRAHFTGDYGLNYDPVSGSFEVDVTETVTIADNQTITGDKIFTGNIEFNNPSSSTFTINNDALLNGDVEITGDLIVQGTTTTINTEELFVADNMITLNSDILSTSNPTEDSGIEINRGASANVTLRWNETNDRWEWSNDDTGFFTLDFNDGITYNATTLKWTADDTVVRTERARIQTLEGTYTFSADSSITVNGNFDGSGDIDLRNADLYVPRTPTTTTISGSIYWDESTNKLWILHANGVDYIELTPTYYVGELSSVGSTATNHFEVYAGVWYEEIPGNHIAHHGFKTLTDDNDIITITEPVPSANVISIAGNIYNIYNKFGHTNDTNYGNITYNKNTGVISFAGVTTRNIRDQISAGWGIAYNPVDGIIKTTISTDNGWKFTTDTAGEVDVLHTDLVTIRGTANISVTHVGNVITIDNTDRSDIASVTAGAGLGGGGEVGDVTLYVNPGNIIEIYNDTVTHSAVLRTDTTSSQGPDFGDTFLMVDSVTTSLEGHVTGLNANSITLPKFYIAENSGTSILINDDEIMSFSNGTVIEAEITSESNNPVIKFHHNPVTRTDPATTSTAPDFDGTFTYVSGVTSSTEGHITAVATNTVTLPQFYVQENSGTNIKINDEEALNFSNGTIIEAELSNITGSPVIKFHHNPVTRTDTTTSTGPDFGGTIYVVDSVSSSTEGHITGLNANAITLPQFYVQENSGTNIKINDEEALNFSNGNIIEAELTNTTGSPIIKFHHNLVARADSTATAEGPDNAGTFNVVSAVNTTPEGHVTGIVTKDITLPTFNIQGNGGTEIQINDDEEINFINGTITTAVVVDQTNPTVTFNHNAVTRTNTTTTAGPDFGGTIYVVDSVSSSTEGHITGLNANAITLPKFNIQGNTGTAIQINDDENINFINGTITTAVVVDQANPTVKFDHNAVTRTDPATTTTNPDFNDTFTYVSSVTSSTEGHITAVATNTVTLPQFYVQENSGTNIKINDEEALNFSNGNIIEAELTNTSGSPIIKFHHNTVTRTDTTATAEGPDFGGTINIVSSITTTSEGHVTEATTKDITLPKFNIQGNTGTAIQINDDENINFINGTVTTAVVVDQENPTVKFDHNAVTRTDTTSTATPDFTGTFEVVDGITTSTEGHITAVNVKTVTVPRFHIRQGTDASITINDDENISFIDGTYTTAAVVSQSNPTVTFNHNATTRTDSTSTELPTGNVAMVSSVTTNATGHLTAINVKTVDFDSRYYTETEADNRFVNVTGDTMTGDLTFSDDAEGIVWSRNTDGAYIKFFNTGDGDANSRLEFATMDNGTEFFRWVHFTPGATEYELMTLKYNAGVGDLTLTGAFNCDSYDQYVEDEISKSFPAGALGQVPFVNQDGTRLAEMDYTLKIGQYVDSAEDLAAAQTRITTQEDIFLTWYRFSHSGSVNYPANAAELTAWTYNAGTELINNTTNSGTYIGMVSIDRYVDYVHEVRLYSPNSDDDAIGVVIAFHDDGVREHTLSALRSTGGNGFTWQIWYNYSQADAQLIADGNSQIAWGNGAYGATSGAAGYVSNQAIGGWDDFGTIGTKVKITRNGDSILCETTELGSNTYKAAANLSFSLTGLAILDKFRGPKSIGYSTYSQADSFFEIINFADISNAIVDSRDGTIYLYQSGAWVAQPVATFNVWSEIGVGRLLYDEYTQNMFYVDSETSVTKVVHNRDDEFTLKASSDGSMISLDTRGINYTPSSRNAGLYADFKDNATTGLNDGFTYHGVLTFRPYGLGTDMTGGTTHQLGFTNNGNLWMRESVDDSTWNAWHKINYTGGELTSNVVFTGTATTADQNLGIFWTAFDKEAVNDFTDTASISHTVNVGGHTGSVLLFQALNDAQDGIAFTTHASSQLKHNGNTIYTSANFPVATTTTLGGIKLGSDTEQTVAANSVSTDAGRTYAIQLNATDQAVVNVPWTDTVYTHPTFTGNDLGAALTGAAVISDVNVNSNGHVTGFSTRNLTASDVGAAASTHTHAYLPLAGGTMNAGAAISWPNDAYGGSGDVASLSVYNPAGEDTVLRLYVNNDVGDRIELNASGGVDVTRGGMRVTGLLTATQKSFTIDHPTKPGMKLRYGSLEGPENGVYVRGKTTSNVIELPDYWTGLVDPESITVQLTANGSFQQLFVKEIVDNKVYIENAAGSNIDCFYFIQGERVDVDKLIVEFNAE